MLDERNIFRLLVSDPDGDIFTDEQADALIAVAGGSVTLAAAMGLESIAGDPSKAVTAVSLMDLSVSMSSPSTVLMERAARLRQQAEAEPAVGFAQLTVDWNSYLDQVMRAVVDG